MVFVVKGTLKVKKSRRHKVVREGVLIGQFGAGWRQVDAVVGRFSAGHGHGVDDLLQFAT